jgi:hypothetical protein
MTIENRDNNLPVVMMFIPPLTGRGGWRRISGDHCCSGRTGLPGPASAGPDPEHLKIDPRGLAVRLDHPDCAAPEQRRASAVDWCAPDQPASAIYGCLEINIVAVRKPVDEPS